MRGVPRTRAASESFSSWAFAFAGAGAAATGQFTSVTPYRGAFRGLAMSGAL